MALALINYLFYRSLCTHSLTAFVYDLNEKRHEEYPLTCGRVMCSVTWPIEPTTTNSGTGGGDIKTSPTMHHHHIDPVAAIGMAGIQDIQRLADWVQKARIDPNDPKYADLFYHIKV